MDSAHSRSDKVNTMRTEEICCSFCSKTFVSRMGLYNHFHNQHGINQAFRGYSVFAGSTQPAAPSVPIPEINSSNSINVSQPEQTNEIGNDISMSEIKVETFPTDMPASTSVPSTFIGAASFSPPIANVINSASKVIVTTSQSDNLLTIGSIKFVDQTATSEHTQVSIVGQSIMLTSDIKSVTNNGLSITPLLAPTANRLHTTTKTLSQSRSQLKCYTGLMSDQPNTILYSTRCQSFHPTSYASQSIQSGAGAPTFFNTSPQIAQTNKIGNDVCMSEIKVETFPTDMRASTSVSVPSRFTAASKVKVNTSQSDNLSTIGSIKFVDHTATVKPMQVSIDGKSIIMTSEIKSVTNNGLSTTPLLAPTSNRLHTTTETLSQSRSLLDCSTVSMSDQPNTISYSMRYPNFYPPSYASQSIQSGAGAPSFFNTSPATVNIIPNLQTRPYLQFNGDNSAEYINSEDETMTNEPLPSVTHHYMPGVGPLYGGNVYLLHYHPYDSTLRSSYLYNPNYHLPNP